MSRAPKRTPRERLVEHARFGSTERQRMLPTKYDAALRRLLRAHERDLAERAVKQHRAEMGYRAHPSSDDSLRAAILGPKRGRR